MPSKRQPCKIMFVGTEDWAFCRHRLPMARALKAAGHEIVVCARENTHRATIEGEGFRFVPWSVNRGSLNPLRELAALLDLVAIVRREKPGVMIDVALKAILYGAIAQRFAPEVQTVSLFAGLGAVFIHPRGKMKAVQRVVIPLLRRLHGARNWIVVQNADNRAVLQNSGIGLTDHYDLIPGSGVDLQAFPARPEPANGAPVRAALVGRLLWDKGIGELAEAARRLKARGVALDIILVGAPDPENPATVPEETLRAGNAEGLWDWRGPSDDIAGLWADTHIALLPSYGEGVPKSLLEAAATGRPMIGFDAPGVRDLIEDGVNGVLVPFKDAAALAEAMADLAENADTRRAMGQAARRTVERTYAADVVGAKVVDFIDRITTVDRA